MFHFKKCLMVVCVMGMVYATQAVAQQQSTSESADNLPKTKAIPEIGYWATKENDGVFYIYQCGQKLCGRFVGMKYTGAEPPKTSKGHSQCNFEVLRSLTKEKDGKKWVGKIADPRDEQTYDAKIWLSKPDQLKLRGYMGISLFGETHVWHRFHGNIQKNCHL